MRWPWSRSHQVEVTPTAPAGVPTVPPSSDAGGEIAPWPIIDRYPTVMGTKLTLQYLSNVYRLSLTGYRREYVDALDELLERDPNMFATYSVRILAVASARIELEPAKCGEDDKKDAEAIALEFDADIEKIDNLRQSLASLLWAIYYGVSGSEIGWENEGGHWRPVKLWWIHSRRIAYPDPDGWTPRIWDMGAVHTFDILQYNPKAIIGIDVGAWPGKFVIHSPQLRGDYPTRDGLGRETAYWAAIKIMAARQAGQYVERFAKPWVVGYYRTSETEWPRAATQQGKNGQGIGDVKALYQAAAALGTGNCSWSILPDSTKLDMLGPGVGGGSGGGSASGKGSSKLVHEALINICDAQVAKAVLGNSDTIQAGPNGARSSTMERRKNQLDLCRYDAACLGNTLDRDLGQWWMKLNHPDKLHLQPRIRIYVDEQPDPLKVAKVAYQLASVGAPIDADDVLAKVGLKALDPKSLTGRRLFPIKVITDLTLLDASIPIEKPLLPDAPFQPGADGSPAEDNPETEPGKAGESATTKAPPAKKGAAESSKQPDKGEKDK